MTHAGKDPGDRDNAQPVRCIARIESDPLDQELAARLNERLMGISGDADCLKALRPSIIEACCWIAVAILASTASVWWLTPP